MSIAPTEVPVTDDLVKRALFLHGDAEREVWQYLRSPENIEATVECLTAMAVQVNNDLAVRGAYHDDDYQEWRRRALAFKRALDRHHRSAKNVLRRQNRIRSLEQQANARVVLRELALAVLHHQRVSADADIRPEPHDTDLWRALDQLCLPVGDDVYTLRAMLTEGVWSETASSPGLADPRRST